MHRSLVSHGCEGDGGDDAEPKSPSGVRGQARCYDAAEAVTTAADLRAAAFLKVVTWARVALVPVILALILAGPDDETAFTVAAGLFAVAALTDFFDGLLARRWAQTSVFGNFL